jgi:predicted ATP-dependent serine protease
MSLNMGEQKFSYGTLYEYVRALRGNPVRPIIHTANKPHVHVPGPQELVINTINIADIRYEHKFLKTGKFIDRLFCRRGDGGLMGGSTTIIAGESSAGKTVVGLGILSDFKARNPQAKIGYLNSEMSKRNLSFYIEDLPNLNGIETLLLREYQASDVKKAVELFLERDWDVILVDSFQDILEIIKINSSDRRLEGWFVDTLVKKAEKAGTAILAIQHMTKAGVYKGSTYLKHATDAMLEVRLDGRERYVIYSKNRVGIMDRKLYFKLQDNDITYDVMRYHADSLAIENAISARQETEETEGIGA